MNYKIIFLTPLLSLACVLLGGLYTFHQHHNEKKVEVIEKPAPSDDIEIKGYLEIKNLEKVEVEKPEVPAGKKVSKVLEKASAIIQKFESCRVNAYHDPKTGNLPITIGFGSTVDLDGKPFKMGRTITKAYALKLLETQLEKDYIPQISKVPHWSSMTDNKKVALISFGYNLGKNFYGHPKFTTITKQLASKQWKKIPNTFKLYSNPKSNVHPGLLARRQKEGEIWKHEET